MTRAALEDAHTHIRCLEGELARARRELGEGQAARDLAGGHVNAMLAELHRAIADSGRGAGTLAQAPERMAGSERFLKAQNDAVR